MNPTIARLIGLLSLVTISLHAAPLRIAVSDLLEPALSERLEAIDLGDEAEVTYQGSLLSEEALAEGTLDLAILALPEGEAPAGMLSWPFAYFVVTFAVHETNPLDAIDLGTLAAIWQRNPSITDWEQLGLGPTWMNREINLRSIAQSNNLMTELFRAKALNRRPLNPIVSFDVSAESLFSRMRENAAIMAILPTAQTPVDIRLLRVGQDTGGATYSPSADNLMVGDYSLRLPFHLVVRPEAIGKLTPLLRELLNEVTAKTLLESNYEPAPYTERREILLDLREVGG